MTDKKEKENYQPENSKKYLENTDFKSYFKNNKSDLRVLASLYFSKKLHLADLIAMTELKRNTVYKILERTDGYGLIESTYVEKLQEKSGIKYTITKRGIEALEIEFDNYLAKKQQQEEEQQALEKSRYDAVKRVEQFSKIFTKYHEADILAALRDGKKSFTLDFNELAKIDPYLADALIDDPEQTLRAAEVSLDTGGFDFDKLQNFRIRVKNLPDSEQINIGDIRHKNLNKLVKIEGIVRFKSDVRPNVSSARFECPSCGNVITLLQLENMFKEPWQCGCGRKGNFRMLSREFNDIQKISLEEPFDMIEGANTRKIDAFLKDDLITPMNEKKVQPGSRITLIGIVKDTPIYSGKRKSTTFDIFLDVIYVMAERDTLEDLRISKKEEKEILKLSKDPYLFKRLRDSIAPSIFGNLEVKEGLLYQIVSGNKKRKSDGTFQRGDLHVLLLGDPGQGKSHFLQRVSMVSPKSRYTTGHGVSGVGLTAAVTKDELTKQFGIQAGALVLANKGMLCVDELDKMHKEDRKKLHEGMEQQTVSIDKGGISATLKCETKILAGANPKYGRFDEYESVVKQIDLPPALINRFDLIFIFKDTPEVEKDRKLANYILGLEKPEEEYLIDSKLLTKYFAYATQHYHPVVTKPAMKRLADYFVEIRNGSKNKEGIPLTPRQLITLIRLTEASAKLRLSNKGIVDDADNAIRIFQYVLYQLGSDDKGNLDIDRIYGYSAIDRNVIRMMKEAIAEYGDKQKLIPIEGLIEKCKEKGIADSDISKFIEKFKEEGEVFQPRPGYLQILN